MNSDKSIPKDLFGDIPASVARGLHRVETTGSVSDAARSLGISQPALSKGIAQLEKRLKLPLLRRGTRPLTLTEEGRTIALYAVKMDQLRANTLHELEEVRRNLKGVVRVGSFGASASTHILPRLLKAFSAKHSEIGLEVYEYTDQDVLEALREGLVDCAVLSDPPQEELDVLPIASDRLVALLPETHPLTLKANLTAKELASLPFILTKGGSAPQVLQWFANSGQVPRIHHQIMQVSSIVASVRAGLGISVIAELAVPSWISGVTACPLHPPARRQIFFARPQAALRSSIAELFWKYCESCDFGH
ncbi:LysR family transcriptional regulator [Roseibium algae]|uniref:LysR family transcriptional regulator n=1 Tax=Roseibium algae TaxID=3123038 RepID=A0ABU8TGT4_9HYPH